MEAKDIIYKYIEFFFSKTDLHSMMTIKPLSYENWLQSISDMYSVHPKTDKNTFHYNIMHTDEYKEITKLLREIHDLSTVEKSDKPGEIKTEVGKMEETEKKIQENKTKIEEKFQKIKGEYAKLYYYDEIYVYAHYVFNNIRKIPNLGIQKGGGHRQLTLEEFKEIIREKIKMLDL